MADLDGNGKPVIIAGHVEAASSICSNDGSAHRFNVVRFGDNKGTV